MSRPVLVKLGGSIVTDKDRDASFRRAVTRRLLSEIAKADVPVILFHGAGSYGHPLVKEAGLDVPPVGPSKRDAVTATLASVTRLHAEILVVAAAAGLKPVSVPIHAMMEANAGALGDLPVDFIEDLLRDGFMPVLHGSMVPDDTNGWSVVSADRLMAALAEDVEPRLAVFATNVDGVLDANGDVLPEVQSEEGLVLTTGAGADVTGSMQAKVRAALQLAAVCPTVILNGNQRGRLLDALKGKPVIGTRPLP